MVSGYNEHNCKSFLSLKCDKTVEMYSPYSEVNTIYCRNVLYLIVNTVLLVDMLQCLLHKLAMAYIDRLNQFNNGSKIMFGAPFILNSFRQGWRRWAARREQPPTRCRDTSGGVARPSAAGSRAAAAVSRRGNPRLRP
uniref:Uncharacterized protein n=1 Tax=Aegilops tauschii subsp. strangulata TaxID=200361 RepID=A0A453IX05_AEGTS